MPCVCSAVHQLGLLASLHSLLQAVSYHSSSSHLREGVEELFLIHNPELSVLDAFPTDHLWIVFRIMERRPTEGPQLLPLLFSGTLSSSFSRSQVLLACLSLLGSP